VQAFNRWDKYIQMAEEAQAERARWSPDQERLMNHPMTGASSPEVTPAYDPAVGSQVIRSEAEARHELLSAIKGGSDGLKSCLTKLHEANLMLARWPGDPAMIEAKEAFTEEFIGRLRRFMRRGSGITEESLTVETNHRRQQY
jgi:hypothetical protein